MERADDERTGDGLGAGKDVLGFVDPAKGARHYVHRYVRETKYHAWFHRNYPDYAFHEGIGISEAEFRRLADELAGPAGAAGAGDPGSAGAGAEATEEDGLTRLGRLASMLGRGNKAHAAPESPGDGTVAPASGISSSLQPSDPSGRQAEQVPKGEDLARTVFESYPGEDDYDRRTFEEFVDERMLISRDLFGKKEMKIKILEVSDEIQESKIRWKFGDRVKVDKILVTIKHLDTMDVEEGEFDIKVIERELAEKRHWSSTNRWIPSSDIKNGYVVNSKHTALISDAVALDYIVF